MLPVVQPPGHLEQPSLKSAIFKDDTPCKRTSVLKNGRFQGRKRFSLENLLLLGEVYAYLVVVVALGKLCNGADFRVLLAKLFDGFLEEGGHLV